MTREASVTSPGTSYVERLTIANNDAKKLRDLADLYILSFIRVFRSSRRPTPSASEHPSRQSFDSLRDSLKEDLEPTPRQKSCKRALRRDAFRCVATGTYSVNSCPHIARSINEGVTASEGTQNEAAKVWAVMLRFGRISPLDLNGDQVHRLENVITLYQPVRTMFDQLKCERQGDDPYTCLVQAAVPRDLLCLPKSITLTTTDPDLPRTSPDYLRLRAFCARVANLSGAAEYVESTYRGLDNQGVLANDGSSAMALQAMLSVLAH